MWTLIEELDIKGTLNVHLRMLFEMISCIT